MNRIKVNVVNLLKKFPEARNDDRLLLELYFVEHEGINTCLSITQTSCESITRCRRKIQEEMDDLRSDPEVEEYREKREVKMKDYFKDTKW
tara:strand:- start:84 stop:356 length:273 start_codon:yes stop_codon:yes gene_type:complete